ncbi:MAG: efflux RND transporter periplasmic adaptor subunit [Sphingomonas sp.]|jgi:HlyD family secretion protein|uniref:efflux RND transporter periplasmic adaptor subunit n=1 Tax=unclassified Sphingomonas TaxID=196159 RepID=UPI001E643729|nr:MULTISPECIES: HlyD family efflux transporter periplasmic adaptor subunit [unclassified Sphingomonas]MDR6847807.1 HlyD family secretion protein [Sphingomonas sp. BE137]MDR7258513.1 HlyD family secretion protein [Sphingomonas sp. BE270]
MTQMTQSGAAMDRRIERPHAKRWRVIVRSAIGVVVVIAALVLWLLMPGSNTLSVDSAAIRTGAVTRAPFRDFVPLRAEVAPLRTVFVTAISGGQVAELAAADGAMVAAGTPLARLSNPSLALDVASRSAEIIGQLSAINGQRLTVQNTRQDGARDLADARNALSKAQTLLAQRQVLFDKGIIARAAIDPVREDVAYQQARVATLQRGTSEAAVTLAAQSSGIAATSQQLRESLAMVRASLSALVLRAPVGGRLTAFTLQPGQMLKSGDPVGQIDSEGQWKLIADVDQFYLGRVHTGLGAVADLDGRSYPMTLLKVLPQVTAGRFRVELAFRTSPPVALNRGQTLDVRLILGADRPAIVAPSGGWLDAGGTMAFVLDGDSKAVRRAIVTGRRNPDQVEVISGLAPGDRIVTTALTSYAPFQTLLLK